MGLGSGIRDPGSRKNLFRIPDPGVKKAPDPGSDPQHLSLIFLLLFQVCSERSAGAAEAFCAGEPRESAGAGRTGLRSLLPHPSSQPQEREKTLSAN
jgi:hypothetical protein